MLKFDNDIKKRWLLLAFINMVILLLIFGALMVGFGSFAVNADKKMLKDGMREYAGNLGGYSVDQLKNFCNDESMGVVINEVDVPGLAFALYTMRGDGSYSFATRDRYISANKPQIGGRLDEFQTESIGGNSFLTYTVSLNSAPGSYLKIFAPAESIGKSDGYVGKWSALFAVAFIIVGVAVSLIWGYIEIKPVMASYYKQKSFINDMSHEIRTPLAIIKGNLENIIATPDSQVRDVYEMLDSCVNEVDYMTDMSSGLLNIVRGENKSSKKENCMSDVVSEVADMYSEVATMSNKSFIATIERCDIMVDREKVKQLITILVENAIKYTRDGDRINVKLKNTNDGCVLTVADTGIGVPKNELEQIFDRFYRAENAKEIQGTGLGLAIAKAIVENMNGTIKAVSNIPEGLEIVVQLKRT